MRWLILFLPLILFQPAVLSSPDSHARLAAEFLSDTNKSVKQADKPFVRFLSWYNLADSNKQQQVMRFWINNLHFESDVEFPKEVQGSNGDLYWFDLRDYGWSASAWSAVAQREPYFREPAVNSGPAIFLRGVSGVQQGEALHVDSIVRADWFFRETCELDRSPSYYDLLYAKQRFGDEEYTEKERFQWAGGIYPPTGRQLDAGEYQRDVTKARKKEFVDFPKNEADIEKLLGVDSVLKFIRDTKFSLQHGAVVEGGEKDGSIVARHNRLVERTLGPIGWYYKTFDVKETSGVRDFAESLQKDPVQDAAEILFRLPAGGQAGLLSNDKKAVLNVADNRFATDASDVRLDARVRNYGSCVVCHESGIIAPVNFVDDMMKAGVDIRFKDKKDARDARSFFRGWERKLKNDQADYEEFLRKTSGMKPAENSREFKRFRDEYDAPVDAAKAAKEMGLTEAVFKQVAARSVKARLLSLVQGMSMPRRTWEIDGYPEAVKLMRATK